MADEKKTTETTEKKTDDVAAKKNRANTKALNRLKFAHLEEFDVIAKEEYKKEGVEYKRRLTPDEEKAKAAQDAKAALMKAAKDLGVDPASLLK